MIHQSPLYPSGTRGIPASSVSNPAVATARFSDGEKRQIVSRLGFAPHDTQSVFQARHRKRAPGAFSPCFPTGSTTTLSELNPPRVNSDFLFPRHKTAVLRLFQGRGGTVRAGTKSPSFCFLPAAVPAQNRAHRRAVSRKSKSPDRHRVWCQPGYCTVGREWLSPFIGRHALQNKTKKGVER